MKMTGTPKEWDLLESIRKKVQRPSFDTLLPLGDDAFAVASPREPLVMSQDMMIEEVHFRLESSSAADLGHKALAVNLSDFAAMGAQPRWAQVSLGLPEKLNKTWLDEFYQSMTSLADRFDVQIVGGDLTASPRALVIDVSLVGSAALPISRHGARAGDFLLCSGPLGVSAQGLKALASSQKELFPQSVRRHLQPEPRLDLLPQLQKWAEQIHALIDLSDGLISECLHLTRKLELGLDLWREKIPLAPEQPDFENALWGGEDYELLMAIPPELINEFPGWPCLGQFNEKAQIALVNAGGEEELISEFHGWKHFGNGPLKC